MLTKVHPRFPGFRHYPVSPLVGDSASSKSAERLDAEKPEVKRLKASINPRGDHGLSCTVLDSKKKMVLELSFEDKSPLFASYLISTTALGS